MVSMASFCLIAWVGPNRQCNPVGQKEGNNRAHHGHGGSPMDSSRVVALLMLGEGLSGLGSDGSVEGDKNVGIRSKGRIEEGGLLSTELPYDA